MTLKFEFDGSPHGQIGLTPASFEGFWTRRYWMDEPVRLAIDSDQLQLLSIKSGLNQSLKSWSTNLVQKVSIAFPNSSEPYLEVYFRDGSMINIYQFGLRLTELKELQHRLRSFIRAK